MKLPRYIGIVIIGIAFLLACSMVEPEMKSGGISIQFVEQNSLAKTAQPEEALFSVRCIVARGEKTVHDRVYSKSDSAFVIEIKNLEQASNYSVLLYGRNEVGCPVGQALKDSIEVITGQVTSVELSWSPNLDRGTVTDIDGNVYGTVRIGDQWWMTENLLVTHYRNGDPIPYVPGAQDWDALESGGWCVYDNNMNNADIYGHLYNWYAVDDSRGLAPEGWHIPSDEEWKQLEMELGMSPGMADEWGFRGTDQGDKMKTIGTLEDGTGLWMEPNSTANNETCFSALPGGWRIYTGVYYSIDFGATFWSSTDYGDRRAWSRSLSNRFSHVFRSYGFKGRGFSVRCIKD